jgi:hypothetical protein
MNNTIERLIVFAEKYGDISQKCYDLCISKNLQVSRVFIDTAIAETHKAYLLSKNEFPFISCIIIDMLKQLQSIKDATNTYQKRECLACFGEYCYQVYAHCAEYIQASYSSR